MKEERYQRILDILNDKTFASVEYISSTLYVSMPTVRRDLNEMQSLGLITRNRGGAMKLTDEQLGAPIVFRNGVYASEKLRIAKRAAELVSDGSVIYIDESSTTLHVIDCLTNLKNISVVTDSIQALLLLSKYKIRTYCIGGLLNSKSLALSGSMAEEAIERFNIDIMFFSSAGVSPQGQIVDFSEPSNDLRRKVLKFSANKAFLCDRSKFGKSSTYNLTELDKVDYIVTNAPLPLEYKLQHAQVILA